MFCFDALRQELAVCVAREETKFGASRGGRHGYVMLLAHFGFILELDSPANTEEAPGGLHAVRDATRTLKAHDFKDGDKRELLCVEKGQERSK
jgi:hypothetical protein